MCADVGGLGLFRTRGGPLIREVILFFSFPRVKTNLTHQVFYVKSAPVNFFEKGAIICESFTRKPRRNELFLYFRERRGKTRGSLLSSARLNRSG